MKLKSKIAMTAIAAALMGVSGAASAAPAPGIHGDGVTAAGGVCGPNDNRQVTVSTALIGGFCHWQDGNMQGDVPETHSGTYTLLSKAVAGTTTTGSPSNGFAGSFTWSGPTGATNGSFTMGNYAQTWGTYEKLYVGFHWGGGPTLTSSFLVELDKLASLTGAFSISGDQTGLSNIYLFSRGKCTVDCGGGGNDVPVPGTIALLGLGLLGLGAARRKLS